MLTQLTQAVAPCAHIVCKIRRLQSGNRGIEELAGTTASCTTLRQYV